MVLIFTGDSRACPPYPLRYIFAGQDGFHTREAHGLRGNDTLDEGMRERTSEDLAVEHVGDGKVIDELYLPCYDVESILAGSRLPMKRYSVIVYPPFELMPSRYPKHGNDCYTGRSSLRELL